MPLCKAIVHTHADEAPRPMIIRQCKSQAMHGADTCRVHKDYFRTEPWMNRILCGENFPILVLSSKDASTEVHKKHILETLLSKRVILTHQYVKQIPNTEQNMDVYRLLCEVSYIHPSWNILLLVRNFVHYVWLLAQNLPHKSYLDSILHNPNMTDIYILRLFVSYWAKCSKLRPIIELVINDLLENDSKMFTVSLYSEKYLLDFMSNGKPTEDASLILDVQKYMREVILPIIRENRQISRQICKDKLDTIQPALQMSVKEELMMKMWAPDYIESYYEKYGIFLLDECDPWLMATAHGPRD
jgi:hypothetical protein